MAKRGRPKKQIDYEKAKQMSYAQCSLDEIASALEVSTRTLQKDKEFMKLYRRAIDEGKAYIRQLQMKKAREGDRQMLIWLGKQYLGQAEKQDQHMEIDEKVTIIDDIK